VIEGFLGHFVGRLLDHAASERLWQLRLLPCKVIARNQDIRVSFSALLRVADGDSYLLVRSLHRPESFGPVGGVYKHLTSARHRLDELQFRPQSGAAAKDMANDLRGFVPRRHLLAIAKWFDEGVGREDAATCLRRELIEELRETEQSPGRSLPQVMQFERVRRIHEGPARAVGQSYFQYRLLEVYDLAEPSASVGAFFTSLSSLARHNKDLLLASSREIIAGRSADGRVIGHHAGYLFGKRRVRGDEPMFVDVPPPRTKRAGRGGRGGASRQERD
jgi:hypothetical protein